MGSEVVVMTGGVTIVRVNVCCAVAPPLSVTVTVNVDVLVAVGVPVIAPVEEFSARGAGNDPVVTAQV